MKQAVFLFLAQMDFGGQERFVSRLSEILQPEYDVYIVLFNASVINYPISGEVLDIGQRNLSKTPLKKAIQVLGRCIRLRRFLKQYRPIACLSFGMGANYINLIVKHHGTKVLPSIRGYATAERMVKSSMSRMLYPRADKIICVSEGILLKLKCDFPSFADKLCVLYNAYDCDQIYKMSQQEVLGCCTAVNNPRLVSVGTLRPEKGYWHLIKAVWLLKKEYPNIHLSIVGEDYQKNGANLAALIDKLHLKDNVTLEGWSSNPYTYIAQSDLYVLSSVREGFPNALVEAMACGKPVIAADCLTGPREILSELHFEAKASNIELAGYGILVPALCIEEDYSETVLHEEELLAEAIDMLLKDPSLRRKYGELAARRALEFSYDACRRNVIRLIKGENL